MFNSLEEKLLLVDLHVQRDLFDPTGTLYTPAWECVYQQIIKLYRWAQWIDIPVLSAVLSNRPGHVGPFGLKPHCVAATRGQMKMDKTILDNNLNLGNPHTTDLPENVLDLARQFIFETINPDPFNHPKFDRLISELSGNYHFVLCGGPFTRAIKPATLGLIGYNHKVSIAVDAVVDFKMPQSELDWLKVSAKGAELTSVATLLKRYACKVVCNDTHAVAS